MRKIEFSPELAGGLSAKILSNLEYTPVTRIYLQARAAVLDRGGPPAANAFTDLPIQLVAEQPLARPRRPGGRGAFSNVTSRANEAERLAGKAQDAQIASVPGRARKRSIPASATTSRGAPR